MMTSNHLSALLPERSAFHGLPHQHGGARAPRGTASDDEEALAAGEAAEAQGASGGEEPGNDNAGPYSSARRRRILIVDDDPDFLAIAEASLTAFGFDVVRASGGLRGVFLATQEVPDAIICDLRMPGIDGFVVAEALRADPATQRTAIFACTGRRDLEARAQVRSSAFDKVLVKPVDWEEVARYLSEVIDARRTETDGV